MPSPRIEAEQVWAGAAEGSAQAKRELTGMYAPAASLRARWFCARPPLAVRRAAAPRPASGPLPGQLARTRSPCEPPALPRVCACARSHAVAMGARQACSCEVA
jgi:hypothetical protein